MITPLLFHEPPRAVGAAQMVCAGPSGKVFFFNLPSANQAMERPSPDQNGYSPPSVPSSSSGASASSSRSHKYVRPSGVVASKINCRPFGESARPPPSPSDGKVEPEGGFTAKRKT